LADAPGEIARALLGWLGVEIDVPPAQVASNEDCASLSDLLRQRQRPDATDGTLHGLTARNRQCALAWALFLEGGPAAAEKLQWFTNWSRSVESEFLAFGLARQERDQGRAVNALRKLLPLANTHRDDAWYYRELALAAIRLDNAILIEEILKHWKQNAPGYEGHLTRGTFLADWSWQTMAGDVATAEDRTKALFRERLEMARAELDRAVSLNPLDWLAHTQLLRVAVGLGLPRQYLDKHFNEATQIQPRSIEAYRYKFMYLEPRWHGKPGELLAFSRECTATGCWSEGIPQLLIEAVQRFCFDEKTGRFDYGPTQRPEIWEAALSLYQSAQTFGRPQDKRLATNFLILCGVRGGHVRELSLVLPKSEEPRDLTTFRDACDYEYARELIAAQSQPPEPLAAIRLALGAADFEGASQILTESTRGADALFPELESRCRAAMQLGKKLHAEKSVELSPVDILDSFTGAFSTYGHVEGDGVICHVVREATALFPIGLRNGVITGVLEWSPELTTVELLLHTRAQRDILHVIYWPNRGIVQLRRNNVFLQEATCPVGPCRFRVEFGPQVDRLEPVPGVTWEVPAEDAGPSGFGFRAAVRDQAGTFTLSKVKIELRD
jgi:hypothetical protein